MNSPQIQVCTTCCSLKELLKDIDDKLYKLIKNKWYNQIYNTSSYFDRKLYRKLLRYKRILNSRMLNGNYPSSCIQAQDIITQATLLIKK